MFGSLVLVFPTPHTGGALVVSHNDYSSIIDFAGILKDQPTDAIAFTAFYSDVEHEVTEVLSGHRVSLTYNLYYVDNDESEKTISKLVYTPTNASYELAYTRQHTTLSTQLEDSDGRTLVLLT